MESALQRESEALEKWVRNEAEQLAPEERQEFFELYIDDARELEEQFPAVGRACLFVNSFSQFDALVSGWCETAASFRGAAFDGSEIRPFDKKVNFLEERIGAHMLKDTQDWTDMRLAQHVRHFLVHSEGRIPKEKKSLKPSLQARIPLTFGYFDSIVLAQRAVPWTGQLLARVSRFMLASLTEALEPHL